MNVTKKNNEKLSNISLKVTFVVYFLNCSLKEHVDVVLLKWRSVKLLQSVLEVSSVVRLLTCCVVVELL